MNSKNIIFSLLFSWFALQSFGQNNCPCPSVYDPVCAFQISESDTIYSEFPNACFAECFGFTVVTDSTLCNYNTLWSNCNCPEPDSTFVCAQDSFGIIFPVPNACLAACWGFTVIEDGDCFSNPWGDCNCPEPDSTYVCAQDSSGNIFPVPSACLAACWGLTVVEDGDCFSNPWGDCNCPEPDSTYVCAQDSSGNIFPVPSACLAACWGLTVVEDGDCFSNPWGDCNCPEPDSTFVCAQDSFGIIFPVPNACLAACWGFTVIEDGDCFSNPWGDCNCPEPDSTYVCAQDSSGNIFPVPSACLAACWGLTVVEDGDCFSDPWGDCNCPEPDSTYVCAQDSSGNIFPVPSACLAACWGLTVVEDGDCFSNPWGDCDCVINEDEPFICAIDSVGHTWSAPNACVATCWGWTVVEDSLCNPLMDDPEIDDEILECIQNLNIESTTTFQEALLMISESCGLTLPECILNAPTFDSDSAFIEYIITNCDSLGFNNNTAGSSVFNLYNSIRNITTDTKEINKISNTTISLQSNPVSSTLVYSIETESVNDVTVTLRDINGRITYRQSHHLSVGRQSYSFDMSSSKSGIFILTMSTLNGQKSLKVVKID